MYLLLLTSLYLVQSPVVDMRKAPDATSEVVSQGYFSETVRLLDEQGEWQKIETVVDQYLGWVKKGTLVPKVEEYKPTFRLFRLCTHLYATTSIHYGPLLTLPFDSRLVLLEEGEELLKVGLPNGESAYIYKGDVEPIPSLLSIEEMCALSLQFLGLPYTWGGRSSFGYDCSGFVQMLYRQMGVLLPRDSKDQITYEGLVVVDWCDLQIGDLLFFGKSREKISHVGIYLGNDLFISATTAENAPTIHISNINTSAWNGTGYSPYHTARRLSQD